ncbi:MAG: response regulator [Thermoproteota archaeon]|nr:response regulator [Thermoproteota archaeon]
MNILIAEDDYNIAMQYRIALENRNHEVLLTYDGEDCLKSYRKAFGKLVSEQQQLQLQTTDPKTLKDDSNILPFDAIVLDYRMPKKDGMEVAKEILAQNPHQRIIFASAYVRESLEDMVKQLNQVVELLQKPFEPSALVDTIEDKEIYEGLEKLNADIELIKDLKATHEQLSDLLEGLRKLQKGRTF